MVTHFFLAGCPQIVKKVYQRREGRSSDLAPLLRPSPERMKTQQRLSNLAAHVSPRQHGWTVES